VLLARCKKLGIGYGRVLTTLNLEVIAELTAMGAGIGIFPVSLARKYPNLKRVPGAPTYKDEVCLVYRHENRNVRALQVIMEAIKKV
jgi:DNA-binding transcriptional LysR family regulator